MLPKDYAAYDWIAGSFAFTLFAMLAAHQSQNTDATTGGQRVVSLWPARKLEVFRGRAPTARSDVDTQSQQ